LPSAEHNLRPRRLGVVLSLLANVSVVSVLRAGLLDADMDGEGYHTERDHGASDRKRDFRAENEHIYASADALSMHGPIPFLCECADPACTEIVRMSDIEYDTVSQYPCRFFNVSGHEASSVEAGAERVLLVIGEFTVVVKVGIAGDVASHARDTVPD
jgi:hypothetical protein